MTRDDKDKEVSNIRVYEQLSMISTFITNLPVVNTLPRLYIRKISRFTLPISSFLFRFSTHYDITPVISM